MKCVLGFSSQLSSETFLILRRIQQDIFINVCWVPVIYIYQILIKVLFFSTDFRKILKYKVS